MKEEEEGKKRRYITYPSWQYNTSRKKRRLNIENDKKMKIFNQIDDDDDKTKEKKTEIFHRNLKIIFS